MVGVVALKNFETGSYSHMRISVFKGNAYSDIANGELISSYIVDPIFKLAALELSNDTGDFVSLDKVVCVARCAREFFYSNTYATQLKFKTVGEDIKFKVSGTKCGVSEPASFRELFGDNSLYMLVSTEKEHTYLWRSALCDAMNFVVQKMLDTSEEVYAQSGGGIYINLALFSPRLIKFGVMDIDPDVFKILKALKKKRIGKLKPKDSYKKVPLMANGFGYHSEAIYLFRRLKHEAYARTIKDFIGLGDKEIILRLLAFPSNHALRKCVDSFTLDASDCITNCFKYSNIEHESYKDMISAREFLLLAHESKGDIAEILCARSSNMRLLKHLPCAKYLLSDATAYWEKGKGENT
jgi:hypothetical protein